MLLKLGLVVRLDWFPPRSIEKHLKGVSVHITSQVRRVSQSQPRCFRVHHAKSYSGQHFRLVDSLRSAHASEMDRIQMKANEAPPYHPTTNHDNQHQISPAGLRKSGRVFTERVQYDHSGGNVYLAARVRQAVHLAWRKLPRFLLPNGSVRSSWCAWSQFSRLVYLAAC